MCFAPGLILREGEETLRARTLAREAKLNKIWNSIARRETSWKSNIYIPMDSVLWVVRETCCMYATFRGKSRQSLKAWEKKSTVTLLYFQTKSAGAFKRPRWLWFIPLKNTRIGIIEIFIDSQGCNCRHKLERNHHRRAIEIHFYRII